MTEHPSNLLPWYVNGSLTDAEQKLIETHLATCGTCQNEIVELGSLHVNVKRIESEAQPPGELGLARLKHRLRSEASVKVKSPRRWLKPVLAAACMMIVLQAGLIWDINNKNEQNMQLLSAPAVGDIQVRFTPHASEKQIRLLLQSIYGHIVDGPSALGIYHIRIESEKNRETALKLAIQTLREQSSVVSFASKEVK